MIGIEKFLINNGWFKYKNLWVSHKTIYNCHRHVAIRCTILRRKRKLCYKIYKLIKDLK